MAAQDTLALAFPPHITQQPMLRMRRVRRTSSGPKNMISRGRLTCGTMGRQLAAAAATRAVSGCQGFSIKMLMVPVC